MGRRIEYVTGIKPGKSKVKRMICVVLAAVVCMGSMNVCTHAAKKATLKNKVMTIKVGEKRNILIKNRVKKNKYTFKSDKNKIASVNARGVVIGRKEGKAVVTVKENKKRIVGKVRVTVRNNKTVNNDADNSNAAATDSAAAQATVTPVSNAVTQTPPADKTPEVTLSPTFTPTPVPEPTLTPTPSPVPFENLLEVNELAEHRECPDLFKYIDGTPVTAENWNGRAEEIRQMYQYYMYGMWRNGTGEELSYSADGNKININVTTDGSVEGQKENGNVSFSVKVSLPKGEKPEKGWPVIVIMGALSQETVALEKGYAVISYDTAQVAADSNVSFTGAFYDLYPYDAKDWKKQSGVLMAWAWGASKILDSLYMGAGEELGIDPDFAIIGGVSRWGKATAVTGAFDRRYKIAVPACSGAGGMGVFRYNPGAKVTQTYDVSDLGYQETVTYEKDTVETISNLQGGESYWFCERFKKFKSIYYLPFDQYFLSALYAEDNRTLLLVGGFNFDIWQNTPSLWFNFQKAKEVFDMMGLSENIIINLHDEAQGHDIVYSDIVNLFKYCDIKYKNTPVDGFSISDLQTTIFEQTETPAGINNKEVYEAEKPE